MAIQPTRPIYEHIENDAVYIHEEIIKNTEFDIPDIGDIDVDLPSNLEDLIKELQVKLTNEDLTTKQVDGSGTFDVLMKSLSNHIREEYESGRITGSDYSKTYTALVEAALSNAVHFLLNRETTFWSSISAQLAAFQARAQLALTKADYALRFMDIENRKAEYSRTVADLAIASATYDRAVLMAPLEKLNMEAQTDQINTIVTTQIPLQNEQIEAQTAMVIQQKDNLSAEKLNIPKQGLVLDAQKKSFEVKDLTSAYSSIIPLVSAGMVSESYAATPDKDKTIDALEALTTKLQNVGN